MKIEKKYSSMTTCNLRQGKIGDVKNSFESQRCKHDQLRVITSKREFSVFGLAELQFQFTLRKIIQLAGQFQWEKEKRDEPTSRRSWIYSQTQNSNTTRRWSALMAMTAISQLTFRLCDQWLNRTVAEPSTFSCSTSSSIIIYWDHDTDWEIFSNSSNMELEHDEKCWLAHSDAKAEKLRLIEIQNSSVEISNSKFPISPASVRFSHEKRKTSQLKKFKL